MRLLRIRSTLASFRANTALQTALLCEAALIFSAYDVRGVGLGAKWRMDDFTVLRTAGRAVLHGVSPYSTIDPGVVLAKGQLPYPPLVAYLFAPFGALPYGAAGPTYYVTMILSLGGALALLGVRDPRCYAVTALWLPTAANLGAGALTPVLVLLAALAWRFRGSRAVAPAAIAVAVVSKLYLWPLAVWYAATRDWRARLTTLLAIALGFLVPFFPLGLVALRRYPKLLHALSEHYSAKSLATTELFRSLGATALEARVLLAVLAVALTALVISTARHGDDARAFGLAAGAALLLSPIVWLHYEVFLVVPLALSRPRLSWPWFVPLLAWTGPGVGSDGRLRNLVVDIGITVAVVTVCATRPTKPLQRRTIGLAAPRPMAVAPPQPTTTMR